MLNRRLARWIVGATTGVSASLLMCTAAWAQPASPPGGPPSPPSASPETGSSIPVRPFPRAPFLPPMDRRQPSRRDRRRCKPEEPVCTDCGALKCLCRPRFFAGQLLTEQDLNRLDAYIRDKNRLHTLQLHGWGVVNGLEVMCNPCGKGVVVGCGYAIGPCGDDIVVCEEVTVDVCAMIRNCRQQEAACTPYKPYGSSRDCEDLVEEWVLAIRYAETPTRGITALKNGGCACGGTNGGCGCGKPGGKCSCVSGGTTAKVCGCGATSTAQKPRAAPAECEPTVICEGYTFDVFRLPKEDKHDVKKDPRRRLQLGGPLWDRFFCCFEILRDSIPEPPGRIDDDEYPPDLRARWHLWCCQVKEVLAAYLSDAPTSNCELMAELQTVPCPDPKTTDPAVFRESLQRVLDLFYKIIIDAVMACLCSALLPPCPEPAADNRVPLAVLRVRRRDCAVVSVCNSTPLRRMAITMPALRYWLSILPWQGAFMDLLHRLCCEPLRISPDRPLRPNVDRPLAQPPAPPDPIPGAQPAEPGKYYIKEKATVKLNPQLSESAADRQQVFSKMFLNAAKRGSRPLDPEAFVGSLLGWETSSEEGQALNELEQANLPQFVVLNQVIRPLLASMFSQKEGIGSLFRPVAKMVMSEEAAPQGDTMDQLNERIARLEAEVNALKQGIQ